MSRVAFIEDANHGSKGLRFTLNVDTVRITAIAYDAFDAEYDGETLVGDYSLADMIRILENLNTAARPVQTQPTKGRPGRRKPRWWGGL